MTYHEHYAEVGEPMFPVHKPIVIKRNPFNRQRFYIASTLDPVTKEVLQARISFKRWNGPRVAVKVF